MNNSSKFLICGCARNCSEYLFDVFKNIETLIHNIDLIEIIISYDTSNDSTMKVLQSLKKRFSNLTIITHKDTLSNQRTLNISNARNRMMDYMSKKYTDSLIKIDYFIMMDLDDVCSTKINMDTFLNTMSKYGQDHDCITFNNENYYDFWALSFDKFMYSCWHSSNPKMNISLMKNRLTTLLNEHKYINVTSAFNGFGIYKFKTFIDSRYDVHPNHELLRLCIPSIKYMYDNYDIKFVINSNIYDCEHRMFHFNTIKDKSASCIIVKDFLFEKYVGHHVQ